MASAKFPFYLRHNTTFFTRKHILHKGYRFTTNLSLYYLSTSSNEQPFYNSLRKVKYCKKLAIPGSASRALHCKRLMSLIRGLLSTIHSYKNILTQLLNRISSNLFLAYSRRMYRRINELSTNVLKPGQAENEIRSCRHIQRLSLNWFQLQNWDFLKRVRLCKGLKELSILGGRVSQSFIELLVSCLEKLKSLKSISLGFCGFTELSQIPHSDVFLKVDSFSFMHYATLGYRVNNQEIVLLQDLISQMKNLKTLSLLPQTDRTIQMLNIDSVLRGLQNITKLYISCENSSSNPIIKSFLDLPTTLEELYLDYSKIYNINPVPEDVQLIQSTFPRVRILDLQLPAYDSDKVFLFASSMPLLQVFNYSSARITCAEEVPTSAFLNKNKSLKEVSLTQIEILPITHLRVAQYLCLLNNLSKLTLRIFPTSLGEFFSYLKGVQTLEFLDFSIYEENPNIEDFRILIEILKGNQNLKKVMLRSFVKKYKLETRSLPKEIVELLKDYKAKSSYNFELELL